MTTLEILRHARATIANPRHEWEFGSWATCTCGHIYKAANGGRLAQNSDSYWGTQKPTTAARVLEAYKAIARVLNLDDVKPGDAFHVYAATISDATVARADVTHDKDDVRREHALSLIDDAIAALEAEYERNRLDVLAQTQRIIDATETPEKVVA